MSNLNINNVKSVKLTKLEFDNVEQKIGKYFSDIDKESKNASIQKNIILNVLTQVSGNQDSHNPKDFVNDAEVLIKFQPSINKESITSISIHYQVTLEIQEKIKNLTDEQKKELSDFAMVTLEPYFRETISDLSYKTQLTLPKLPLYFWRKGTSQ